MTLRSALFLCVVNFLLAGMGNLPAQNPFIQNYTSFDGLPSNNVYQVYQDSRKFIWFATDAGVARFDGTKFIHFSKKDGLSCNDVVHIKEDSSGRIWFFNMDATLNFYLDGIIYNGTNANYLESLTSLEFFRDFYEDSDHTIYFYHNHQREVFALDTENRVRRHKLSSMIVQSITKKSPVEGMDIRYLSKSGGWFYLWTIAGLCKLEDLTRLPVLDTGSFNFKAVFPDSDNTFIWIRQVSGPKYVIIKTKGLFDLDTLFEPIGINSEYVSSVLEDEYGYVWISTYDEGVYCYRENALVRHFDIKQAQAIIEDHEKNIWISSLKDGVYKISPYLNQQLHFERNWFEGLGIMGLTNHNLGGIWMTNGNQVFLLKNEVMHIMEFQNMKSNLNQLLQIDDQTLAVGEINTNYYSIEGIRPDHTSKKIHYSGIVVSPRNFKKLSMAIQEKEITTWDFFTVFLMKPRFFENVKSYNLGERVYNTFYNANNEIIVNASRNFIIKNDSLIPCEDLAEIDNRIISDHMLIEDSVDVFNIESDSIFILVGGHLYNLSAAWNYPVDLKIKYLEYHSPTLFIGTSKNIYYCDYPLKIVAGNPVELQMMDIGFRNIHDILFENDRLYIASDDGLTAISGSSLRKTDALPPIPYFQSVQINNLPEKNEIHEVILTGRNKILMDFSSINYSSSPSIYSYKLEGLDKDWHSGREANVVYESLPRGEYIFKLRARKPTSAWSEPIEYRIRINATIWERPVFYVILSLLMAGIIIIIIILRKNAEIKRREVEHQLVLMEQRALQSMMNPHFIFNSLGSIQSYLLQSKPAEAVLYLSQFARLIRQNLNASNAAMISLEEEVDRLKNYLDLERMRMEKQFEYKIEIDRSIKPELILIPSMIIQPFVENSIWHGISKMGDKGEIGIFFLNKDNKSLKIIVEDNGTGMKNGALSSIKSGKHLAMGMAMTRKRLELLGKKYNLETGIEITEVNPGYPMPGTHVEIVVPFASGTKRKNQSE